MKFKKITSAIVAAVLSVSVSLCAFAQSEPMAQDGETAKKLVTQGANYILQKYKFDVTRDELYTDTLMKLLEQHPELTEEAFKAMYSGLDEHSAYYTQEEFDSFLESMSGEFTGIGVTITSVAEGLMVVNVSTGSSAKEAGIKVNDLIVAADGVDLRGMAVDLARSYITGETGTYVNVGVMRDGNYLEFNLMRKPVVIEPGAFQIIDDTVGYIALDTFDASAPELVDHALDTFDAAGITEIIFDLRYNPGGSVTSLVDICQRIIPEGPVISFEYKNPVKNTTLYSSLKKAKYRIIALANENSASAAEAFCGAVQDSGVGFVVGTTTYGKGTMQNIRDFKVGGGVKLTEAEYLTRNGRHINGVGIKPDEYVKDGTTTLAKAGFNDLDFEKTYKIGDKGATVLAINQRLWAIGYDIGLPTDEYTEKTHFAIYSFQNAEGLYPYGDCDITTQLKLENILQGEEIPDNASFKLALEIFKNGTFDEYMPKE